MAARKGKKLRQTELAELMGVSVDTVRRWEQAKRPPDAAQLTRLSKVLDKAPSYFLEEEGKPQIVSNARFVETLRVPVVGGVIKACCGRGNAYADDVEWETAGMMEIPYTELMGYLMNGRDAFRIIPVEGDSMEPRIHSGELLLFSTREDVMNGNFAVIRYEGRLLVRALWDDGRGHVKLKALNPEYEDIDIDLSDGCEENGDFVILGKVLRAITVRNLADGMM